MLVESRGSVTMQYRWQLVTIRGLTMRISTRMILVSCAISLMATAQSGSAVAPQFGTQTCPVKLNGVRLGSDLTPGGSSLRNTIVWDPASRLYHLWVLANNDPAFPASSALGEFSHATSTDGLHFILDSQLSYQIGSAAYANFGATIDPPLDFLRAAYDPIGGTWKLFAWTENVGSSVGQYNYNSSVNDLGSSPFNTSVQHQGPLQSPFAGNHVGTFGLVDGSVFLRVDTGPSAFGSGGGIGQFNFIDAVPPGTSAELNEADLFVGSPYCWFLDANCGNSDPRIPAYVHNIGRTLRQADGSLASYYSFRNASTSSRVDKQIWFVSSSDNGANWSAPAGVFADGGALTIDGAPLAADGLFGTVESVQRPNICRIYFSTRDADEKLVMVSASTGSGCDALFADSFDGCGN